ncbi:MAG: hypothetical protein IPF82_11630 [Blastocatellia bacterium]|nr:hypothetical protein [Blastocatellia bacterium]
MNRQSRIAAIGLLLITTTLACSDNPSMSVAQEKFERTEPWAEAVTKGAARVKTFEKVDALMKKLSA